MDSLKSPTAIVSYLALATAGGSSLYFYKKIDSLEEELSKAIEISEKLALNLKEGADLKAQLEGIRDGLKANVANMENMALLLENVQKSNLENRRHIKAIVDKLSEEDIDVELNKKKSRSKKIIKDSSEESDSSDDNEYLEILGGKGKGKKRRN